MTLQVNDKLLTRDEAIEILKCSKMTLWRNVKRGAIKQTKIGKKIYFKYSDLLNMQEPAQTTEVVE